MMSFTKEFLLRVVDEDFDLDDGIKVISDKIIDNRRWAIEHKVIFKFQDKFYKFYYDAPATEMQDGCGYFADYADDDLIDVDEVHPVEKTIIIYE